MENDELKDLLNIDFPEVQCDSKKILEICKARQLKRKQMIKRISVYSIIFVLLLTNAVLFGIDISTKSRLMEPSPSFTKDIEYYQGAGLISADSTNLTYDMGSLKAMVPVDIGYFTTQSRFNSDEVTVAIKIGHFDGPANNAIKDGEELYTKSYEEWLSSLSAEKISEKDGAKIVINPSERDDSQSEVVLEIDDFYENYLFNYDFIYIKTSERSGGFYYCNVTPRSIINNIKIDKEYFNEGSGVLRIGICSALGTRYSLLYYYYDKEAEVIYLSEKSMDDAFQKVSTNSNLGIEYNWGWYPTIE